MPTRCCGEFHPSSRPSPHGGHRMGRATHTAVHAAAAPRLRSHSTSAAGTAQTQWCDHATGEASSIAIAPKQVPSARSPRRHHAAARSSTARASGPATTSQRSVGGAEPSARVSAPWTDWLCASAGGPTRAGSSNPSVQYVAVPGKAANPIATVPPKASRARVAVARRPASTSSTTKTSGVSLTPAATPSATPERRRSGRNRSTSTSSIRSRLICPNATFCHTGSRASTATVSSTTSHAGVGRPTPRRTSTTDPARAPAEAPVHTAAASQAGRSASGAISTAANGG